MKNLLIVLFSFVMSTTVMSQKIDVPFISPDSNERFVSVYLSVNDLMVSKSDSVVKDIDILYGEKHIKAKNGFTHFGFRFTANTIYYDTKNKGMVGYFISFNTNEDTLHVVMSEKSGDIIFLDIFKSKTNNMSVVITEMKLNGKSKVYFSNNCVLERRSS
jgi:hypothetical protein